MPDDTMLIPLTHAFWFLWALRPIKSWHCCSSPQLPIPIWVTTETTIGHQVVALCLTTKGHVQQLVAFMGLTHKLTVVTPMNLCGWFQLAAQITVSLTPGTWSTFWDQAATFWDQVPFGH